MSDTICEIEFDLGHFNLTSLSKLRMFVGHDCLSYNRLTEFFIPFFTRMAFVFIEMYRFCDLLLHINFRAPVQKLKVY